jgi:hypothetical protein
MIDNFFISKNTLEKLVYSFVLLEKKYITHYEAWIKYLIKPKGIQN